MLNHLGTSLTLVSILLLLIALELSKRDWRFSIKTAFVSITLVAAFLGLIDFLTRF